MRLGGLVSMVCCMLAMRASHVLVMCRSFTFVRISML
jgi:hypothetical protein